MNETEAGKEKRKRERFTLSLPYSLVIEGELHSGMTRNISLDGVYVETISPSIIESQTGQNGEITLKLESEPIATECRIVYVGGGTIPYPTGVGILFLDPGKPKLAVALRKFFLKSG